MIDIEAGELAMIRHIRAIKKHGFGRLEITVVDGEIDTCYETYIHKHPRSRVGRAKFDKSPITA